MGGIKSYKVFHQGRWHVVEPRLKNGEWLIFVDNEPYSNIDFGTQDKALKFLESCSKARDSVVSVGAYVTHGVGYKYWNENKPPVKLTPYQEMLIRPAPEDFLEGGLYIK